VIELARSGTKVAQLAATFGMSDATIYNWLKQDKIDRGDFPDLKVPDSGLGLADGEGRRLSWYGKTKRNQKRRKLSRSR
jgi:transposase-like protein